MMAPNRTSRTTPDVLPVLAKMAISVIAVPIAAFANSLKVLAVCLPLSRASCSNTCVA